MARSSRELSRRDLRLEADQRFDDIQERRRRDNNRRVVQETIELDGYKALTGRKLEDYEYSSGFVQAELFPEQGRILNIGDPWQVLDRPGIVNLEYETGEEASYSGYPEGFNLLDVRQDIADLLAQFTDWQKKLPPISQRKTSDDRFGQERVLLDEIVWRLNGIRDFLKHNPSLEDYNRIAQVLLQIKRLLHESGVGAYGSEEKNIYYKIIQLHRQFDHRYFHATVVEPAIQSAIIKQRGLTHQQQQEIERVLIEQRYGSKKYQHAELVKGAFPDMDFEDHEFDRITASWSISAHMFGGMTTEAFGTVFNEVDRLLKRDGAAFFWPLNYDMDQAYFTELAAALRTYQQSGGEYGILVSHGFGSDTDITWLSAAASVQDRLELIQAGAVLILLPRQSPSSTKDRIINHMISRQASATEDKIAA